LDPGKIGFVDEGSDRAQGLKNRGAGAVK